MRYRRRATYYYYYYNEHQVVITRDDFNLPKSQNLTSKVIGFLLFDPAGHLVLEARTESVNVKSWTVRASI